MGESQNSAHRCFSAILKIGNPNSVSDARVGALCVRTAVEGAFLNVKINAAGYEDKQWLFQTLMNAEDLLNASKEKEILEIVIKKIAE